MGLKTASFSQARQLIVTSAAPGRRAPPGPGTWTWSSGAESGGCCRSADPADAARAGQPVGGSGHGRPVAAPAPVRHSGRHRRRRARPRQHFYEDIRTGRDRIWAWSSAGSSTASGACRLTVNGNPVRPWDPFLQNAAVRPATPGRANPHQRPRDTDRRLRPPAPAHLSDEQARQAAGPHGWLDQQGFYVYRRDRLIVAGDWLGIRGFRKEDKYILARIAVDIPAELDAEWSIDVRKSATVPPLAARPHLQRIGAAARRRAAAVLSHRGRITAREHGADFIYAWTVHRTTARSPAASTESTRWSSRCCAAAPSDPPTPRR